MLQSLNHAELATAVCVLTLALALGASIGFILARINNVADTLRNDFIKEDEVLYLQLNASEKKIIKMLSNLEDKTLNIQHELNQPLYEVGNTVWYNKGNNGEQGVHQDLQGVIVSIEPSCGEPHYKVNGQGGIEETIRQSHITAWTN